MPPASSALRTTLCGTVLTQAAHAHSSLAQLCRQRTPQGDSVNRRYRSVGKPPLPGILCSRTWLDSLGTSAGRILHQARHARGRGALHQQYLLGARAGGNWIPSNTPCSQPWRACFSSARGIVFNITGNRGRSKALIRSWRGGGRLWPWGVRPHIGVHPARLALLSRSGLIAFETKPIGIRCSAPFAGGLVGATGRAWPTPITCPIEFGRGREHRIERQQPGDGYDHEYQVDDLWSGAVSNLIAGPHCQHCKRDVAQTQCVGCPGCSKEFTNDGIMLLQIRDEYMDKVKSEVLKEFQSMMRQEENPEGLIKTSALRAGYPLDSGDPNIL